jgi:hypothetical protein
MGGIFDKVEASLIERKVMQFKCFPGPIQLPVCRVGLFSSYGSVAEKILLNQGLQQQG